jgi:predicted MFS family arabinose efflux permease
MTTRIGERTVIDQPHIARPSRPKRWPALLSLAAASFVDRSEDQTLSILWPHIQRSLGVSVGALGTILSIGKVVNTIMLPLWGYATDRWSRKLLLVGLTGFWGLWTLAIWYSVSWATDSISAFPSTAGSA